MNIASRAGRWSAAHWKTATFGWLAMVVCAVAVGHLVGTVKLTDSEQSTGQSARAQLWLNQSGFPNHAGEAVLIQSRRQTAAGPGFRQEIKTVVAGLKALPQIDALRSPLAAGNQGQISKDGRSALIEFNMKGDADTAADRVQPVLNAVAALQRAAPRSSPSPSSVTPAPRTSRTQPSTTVSSKAETLSLPITFLVLLVAFGAFVAAGLPVVLAFSAVLASGGLAAVASHLVHASDATSSVMLLMGMAVGVDYSLFYLKREREERRLGHVDALQRAAATSGRAVLASGITVLIAMAGMLLTGSKVFDSIGIGAMLVVFVAMVGSLTVLPALLGRLGDKVDKGRIRRARPESRVWNAILRPVLRFPLPAAIALHGPAGGAGAADAGAPHDAAGRERSAAQHSGRAHLREDPEGVPGFADAGGRGVTRPRRRPRPSPRRRSPSSSGWPWPAVRPSSRSRPPSTAATPPRRSRSRWSETAATMRRWPPWPRCATRCCRPASDTCPEPSSRSPERRRARMTSTLRSSTASRWCSRSCSGWRSCCC